MKRNIKKWRQHLLKTTGVWGLIAALLVGVMGNMLTVMGADETTASGRTFVHPGMLHTEESFAAMQYNVENEVQPNLDTWNALNSDGFSAANWSPRPLEEVVRGGTGSNYAQFYIDIRRAYQTALVWKVGGSEEHGEAACRILNAWSQTMTTLSGNADRFLAAGIYGYQLANVAEIMREHPSFDQESMETLLLDVFYPMNMDFLQNHNGAHIGNYWANWDLCNIASVMAIGIFTDRSDIYDQAVDYYKTGVGNGSIYNAMPYVYEDGTAQWQESGRDQGHTTLGIGLCEVICEMAWNQGDDLYGLSDNRFLKGAEYVAKYNNGEDVQYSPYEWKKGQTGSSEWQNAISEAGRPSSRPVYSMVYNHYVNRMGLSAPNLKKVLMPNEGTYTIEGAQSNGDEFGWQTLTFANTGTRISPKTIQGDFKNGKYRIRSVLTNKSLVVDSEGNLASAESGTKDEEWWYLKNTGDGEYTIRNAVTNQVMEVESDYYTYASSVGTGDATGAYNQRFAFVKNADGSYRLVASISGLVLDLLNGGTTDDTALIQYRYLEGNGQKWIIEPADTPEILADFTFDDEESGFTSDYGTASGTYTLQDHDSGNALYLDGTSNFLEIKDNNGSSLLTGINELTISMQVKPESANTNWLFYAAPNTNTQQYQKETYLGILDKSGELLAERYNNTNGRPQTATTTVPTDWYYVTVVHTEEQTIIYVNGEEKARQASAYSLTDILGDNSVLYIGKANWESGEYYKGLIDNLKIQSYALTAEEVKEQASAYIPKPEVLADFTFDNEESGFTSSYGIAEGTYSLQGHDDGKALYLDGTSNFLEVTTKEGSSLLTGVTEMTVSFQAKPENATTNWLFYAAPNTNTQEYREETYLGILDNNGSIVAERFNNTNSRPSSATTSVTSDKWYYLTVVQTATETIIYVNGEEAARQTSNYALADILGENSILYIGKANWQSGEYYKGLIDNYTIISRALNAEEIKADAEKYVEKETPQVLVEDIFEDINADDWYRDSVQYVYDNEIMKGLNITTFAPLKPLSRAECASVLYSANGMPAVEYKAVFPDVAEGEWYADAVIWASQNGIVNGYGNGTFGPADAVTREQMAIMMFNYATAQGYTNNQREELSKFSDAGLVSWYAEESMQWAVGAGVITGKDGGSRLDPHSETSRAECAAIIQKFILNCAK